MAQRSPQYASFVPVDARRETCWRPTWPLRFGLVVALQWFLASRLHAEDHVDYRFEYYKEGGERIQVDTQSLLFDLGLADGLTARGEMVYDSISGASPIGKPPLPGESDVQLYEVVETRWAGVGGVDYTKGQNTLSPQISYSTESDYVSTTLSLNDAISFNKKNTTLRLGVAHSFDEIEPSFFTGPQYKNTTDFLVGISQILTTTTIFTADFTYGNAAGYLSDPYKQILFTGFGDPNNIHPENRPAHRERQVLLVSLTQYVNPLEGSAELSYRFYHDSYDVFSHTVEVAWFQRIGEHLILAPVFRYYEQSAAYFYYISVPGFVPGDGDPNRPEYYSADYRLSHLQTFTFGAQATVLIADRLALDIGYQRYEMYGLDDMTAASNYPKANIATIGFRLWF